MIDISLHMYFTKHLTLRNEKKWGDPDWAQYDYGPTPTFQAEWVQICQKLWWGGVEGW